MKDLMMQLWQDESGQDLAEYALLLGLIALLLVVAIGTFRDAIAGLFNRAETVLDEAGTAAGGGGEGGDS